MEQGISKGPVRQGVDAIHPSPSARPDRGRWPVYPLAFLTIVYAYNYFDRQLLGLLLPQMQQDLQLSDTALGLLSGAAFAICYAIAGVPIARLADRVGRHGVIGVGFLFWSAATAAAGFASGGWSLAASRVLTGIGEAAGVAPASAMVTDLVPENRRAFALGILTSGNALGAIILFPLAGWIATSHGWRMAFWAAGVSGFLLALLFLLTVSEPSRISKPRAEKAAEGRLVDLLSVSAFRYLILAGSLMGISLYATQIWSSTYLARSHGLSIAQIGATIGPIRGVTSLVGALAGGYLASRLGAHDRRWLLWLPGLACIGVVPAEALFLFGPGLHWSLLGYGVGALLSTLHLAPTYAACVMLGGAERRASAVAIFLLFVNLVGQVLGPLLVGIGSDLLVSSLGAGALRASLLLTSLLPAIAGLVFLRAARPLGPAVQDRLNP